MARYIILGAGAVGGVIGARLHATGHDVTLIARGAHRDAMIRDGLIVRTRQWTETFRIPVAADLSEVSIGADDVVILGLKTQDAALILDQLAAVAHPDAAIICAQNGIESERMALRFFANVYGGFVYISVSQIDPGVVSCYYTSGFGVMDLGRYPGGIDARCEAIAADFRAGGISAETREDIMYWKRGKLVVNTNNAINAAGVPLGSAPDLTALVLAETRACLAAAKLPFASREEMARRTEALKFTTVGGKGFPGSSTYQSLARGNPTTEADYLNGEIVLIGREVGFPTPINAALQALIRRLARDHTRPGEMAIEQLRALILDANGGRTA